MEVRMVLISCSLALEPIMGKPQPDPEHGVGATQDMPFTYHLSQYQIIQTDKKVSECKQLL